MTTALEQIPIQRERARHSALQDGVVLITSISSKVPMIERVKQGAAKLDASLRVESADSSDAVLGKYFTDYFWLMPETDTLTLEELLAHCRARRVRAIFLTRDGELAWFSRAAPELARHGVHVMVSAPEAIDTCVDKLRFARLPGTIPAFAELPADATGRWVVKERFGAGSRGIGLNLSPADGRRHARTLAEPIFQPFIAGPEFSADLYVDRQRRIKGCVVRSRDVVVDGESQVTTTVNAPVVEAACRRIAALLPFHGHLMMQAIVDEAGRVHVIECNARFGGASGLSIAAGLDSFYWFLLEAAGEDLAAHPCTYDPRRPLRQIRHVTDFICAA